MLVGYFGVRHFDLVEDMVQSAMLEAVRTWQTRGVADRPAVWIHPVAKNRVIDTLRRDKSFQNKAADIVAANKR